MSTQLVELAERDSQARAKAQETRDELVAAIDAAYMEGRTVRELATETGLSFQRIHQIVSRPGGPGPRRAKTVSEA